MTSATAAVLQKQYPWTRGPFIINGPMRPFVTAGLASEVSLAGGLGFLSWIPKQTLKDLEQAKSLLAPITGQGSSSSPPLLPLGVGYVIHSSPIDSAITEISTYRPAAVWLFAPSPQSHPGGTLETWSDMVRKASPETAIWVQVGSVADALEAVKACAPSHVTIVAQGIDAGGHGLAAGAGIVTLLPEIRDALSAAGHANVPVIAAGGIVESRAAAAAFALGADGVILGTRMLCAKETFVPDGFQRGILEAEDGGQSTLRTTVFDRLRGTKLGGGNGWPLEYDGRGLKNLSSEEEARGEDWTGIKAKFDELQKENKPERFGAKGRDVIYAGTGVGLIKNIMPAREIVEEVRNGVVEILERTRKQFSTTKL